MQIGDVAPLFETINQIGESFRLEDYKGNKLILYFYPKDDTPTCTKQACNLRDNFEDLQKAGYLIFGISTDEVAKHQKFIQKYQLPFSLLVDTDLKIHQLYGTWQEKSMYGKKYMGTVRTTFIIDEAGKIANIIEKVKAADHSKQILDNK